MTSPLSISEIAGRMAAVIRERGHHKGDFMPEGADPVTCPVCFAGAFNVVTGDHPDDGEAESNVTRRAIFAGEDEQEANDLIDDQWFGLLAAGGIDPRGVPDWNDDPARTVDDILRVLDAVASGGGA